MISIEYSKNKFIVKDQSSVDILRKGHFGQYLKPKIILSPEEALYLMDMRNAQCISGGRNLSFNYIAARFWKSPKFTARYLTYKDWRDRGLVVKPGISRLGEQGKASIKKYPKSKFKMKGYMLRGIFFSSDLISIMAQSEEAKEIYEKYWMGQYGSYKAADRGRLNKLDIYETVYLMSKGMLKVDNATKNEIVKYAANRRGDFGELYDVYCDWREKGYVIKTGFKFGAHFRVYFPGARPMSSDNSSWVHSKHVIQVFPKESKLLISEWARAIRVAHSVRKTFILAIPGKASNSKISIDYTLYHRKGGDAQNPDTDRPKYAMLSLSEEEYIGGSELAAAISQAKSKKLELILAIADRETSVTYYKVRQIRLSGSKNEYYEIDWLQP